MMAQLGKWNHHEWKDRLTAWKNELATRFYRPLGTVDLEGFATDAQLSADEAMNGEFAPIAPGDTWGDGKPFMYQWFRGTITTPTDAVGKKLVFRHGAGPVTGLIFIDGQPAGQMSPTGWASPLRFPMTLALDAQAGQTFDLLMEAYAGNHPADCHGMPKPHDYVYVPETSPNNIHTMEPSTVGWWDVDAFDLWIDIETADQIFNTVDVDSTHADRLREAIQQFTMVLDLELPDAELRQNILDARAVLAPVLAEAGDGSDGTLHAFGHGHLDVAWLWPIADTERKVARTLANQLSLIEDAKHHWGLDHKFLQPQPHTYWMLENTYPELFERTKQAIADGNIIADGAVWVEPDTNMSSGESLIRQFLFGKRYFKDVLGVDSEVLWLPDVFGYCAALPQIMRGCGVNRLSTWKIYWNYHGGDDFPHHLFNWEGLDGSQVLVELITMYGNDGDPSATIDNWKCRRTRDARIDARIYAFGHSDGGGGPDIKHTAYIARQKNLKGAPKFEYTTLKEHFDYIDAKGGPRDTYVGELYFQAHRGVLTSQAKTKMFNRKCEFALREAECWSALAGEKFSMPLETMVDAWRTVLLNQFHDILPGSSIKRVYDQAEAEYAEALADADAVAADARATLTDNTDDAMTLFNSLSWDRRVTVALPEGWAGANDDAGNALCVQPTDEGNVVATTVPSVGYATIHRADAKPCDTAGARCGVTAEAGLLENNLICVTFNASGEMTSVLDKSTGRETLAGLGNEFKLFKDMPTNFDAWDIDSMYEDQPVAIAPSATIEVVTSGMLVGALKITRQINNSTLTQTVTLRRDSRRVDFDTTVEWAERRKLLKVGFDTNIHANEAIHEIQFGHVARPNHRSRQYDFDRFEVANQKWTALAEARRGAAVLNDSKYGVNVLGGVINLTLLRAPVAPDDQADRGTQKFTYAFYAWDGCDVADSGLVREGYDLNIPLTVTAGAAGNASLMSIDADNIIIETVKPAEDGSGDVIVRLYEAMRSATRCTLSAGFPITGAVETDMLEAGDDAVELVDNAMTLEFRPFEVKTFRLKR
jgi:alpha-mannosidase